MLRLSQLSSVRLVRAAKEPGKEAIEALVVATRSSQLVRRTLASSSPHAYSSLIAPGNGSRRQENRRRALGLGVELEAPRLHSGSRSGAQWRGLASGGNPKNEKQEGMFDRLRRTFEEEINKVRLDPPPTCSSVWLIDFHVGGGMQFALSYNVAGTRVNFTRGVLLSSVYQTPPC